MENNANQSQSGPQTEYINARYRKIRELGRGGMGVVYLVQDTVRNDKEIVLKVFHSKHSDPETIELLRREFAILSALRHPNLVHVYDFGKQFNRNEYFYTMECIQGKEFLDALNNVSLGTLQTLFTQIVQALGYIHASGILHGDIKSENIMVHGSADNPAIKLMDFGLAVREDEIIKQTLSGTLEYMAPELFQMGKVSIATDLYAVGVLFYWALSGNAPFSGTPEEIKKGHLRSVPPRLSSLGIDVPPKFETVIHRLLAKAPLERYSSCEAVLTALGIEEHDYSQTQNLITPLIMDAFLKSRDEKIQSLLDQVSHTLKPVKSNHANFITITGTNVSGHHRVLQDVKSKMQIDNIIVLDGWCRGDKYSAYQPFIDAFKGFTDLEQVIKQTDKTLSESRLERSEFDLLRFKFMEEISSSIKEVCRGQRIVLMLHNLEFANDAVIDLVFYLGRALKDERISIIVSITSDRQSEETALKIQHGRDSLSSVFDFRVTRIKESELESLLSSAFKLSFLPQGFYPELYKKSGGNIEIIAAIMTALNTSGYFTRSEKTWLLSETFDLSQLDLSNVNDLYYVTYNNLSQIQKSIFKVIAVYDALLDKRALLSLLDDDDEQIVHNLSVLIDRRILIEQTKDGQVLYGFLSNAMQNLVYKDLAPGEEQQIHKDIARLILENKEISHSDDLMALHLLEAGYLAEGLSLASRALKKLKHSFANKRALMISTLALKHCPVENKRLYRVFKRNVAEMQDLQGNSQQALEHYSELKEYYKDGVAKSALLRKISYLYQTLGDIEQAQIELNNALQQASEHSITERALILREISWIYIIQGNYKQAIRIGIQALEVLPDNITSRTLAITLNSLGGASFYAGDITKAIDYFTKSAQVKEQLGDKRSKAATLNNLGIVYNVSGDPEKASQYWRQSMEVMEEVGDWAGLAENYNNLGILLMESGQYERAYNYYKKCKDLKNRIGDLRGLVASHCNIGELLYLREDYSNAIQTLQEGIKFSERIKSDSNKAEMLYQLAKVFLVLNQVSEAKVAIDGCLKITESLQDKSKLGEYLVLRAKVHYLETGEFQNEFFSKAESVNKEKENQTLTMTINIEKVNYWIAQNEISKVIKIFPQLQGFLESSNLKWYKLDIMILLSKAMLQSGKQPAIVEKTLEKAESQAQSMGLMLKLKTIYYLRGMLLQTTGDQIGSFKSFRKAFQCMKLCLAHIDQETYKQSLLNTPENIDLLNNIKRMKALLSAA